MEYKGYISGPITFDEVNGVFSGEVFGLRDVIHFRGRDAKELRASFEEGVDDYLDLCRETGRTPERAYRGAFMVRTTPERHRAAALAAAAEGISLSEWVARRIGP